MSRFLLGINKFEMVILGELYQPDKGHFRCIGHGVEHLFAEKERTQTHPIKAANKVVLTNINDSDVAKVKNGVMMLTVGYKIPL